MWSGDPGTNDPPLILQLCVVGGYFPQALARYGTLDAAVEALLGGGLDAGGMEEPAQARGPPIFTVRTCASQCGRPPKVAHELFVESVAEPDITRININRLLVRAPPSRYIRHFTAESLNCTTRFRSTRLWTASLLERRRVGWRDSAVKVVFIFS